MRYVSTRSAPQRRQRLAFDDVLLAGLAPDGGLYVPERVPELPELPAALPVSSELPEAPHGQSEALFEPSELPAAPQDVSGRAAGMFGYAELAARLMAPYVGEALTVDELTAMACDAYCGFARPEVCPLVELAEDHWLLELFHGPTFAFKDIALQVVARMFDHELQRRGERAMIVAATSGDTGSAAMEAVAGRDRLDIVVLHPAGRTSEIQRRQMTTLDAANVHAVALDGTFDDCQDLVKAMFADEAFRRDMRLAAVNSINWARVAAQIVYYVWAARRLAADGRPVTFCVPTGNFGNVLAGHYAQRMGLAIDRLIVASNSNDILSRLLETGELVAHDVKPTLSPSMDIQISSNLERLLFELCDSDGAATAALLQQFRACRRVKLSPSQHRRIRERFAGERLDDAETLEVMRRVHAESRMFIDPHTAVGVGVAERCRRPGELVVSLATAHPAKFPEAVALATGRAPDPPAALADAAERPERCTSLPNDVSAVKAFVRSARRS